MKNIDKRINKIVLYFNQNKKKKAEALLQKLRASQAAKLHARSLADIARRVFNQQIKRTLFAEALDLDSNNVFILSRYANALAKNREYDKACHMFKRSLALNPKHIITLTNYGRALAATGEFEQAFEKFEQALRLNPRNIITLTQYGDALAQDEQFYKSWEMFERALQIDPENIITLTNYGKVLADSGQPNKSIEIFERALQIDPKNIKTLTSYAQALAKSGQRQEALKRLEEALEIDSDDPVTLTSYAQILIDGGQSEKGLDKFKCALEINPDDPITLTNYGSALADLKQLDQAYRMFEDALKVDPNNSITLNSYGMTLANDEQHAEACQMFERALEIEQDNPVTLNNYGTALANQGLLEEAREKLEHSLQIKPDKPATLVLYAAVLEVLGEYEEAISHIEQILVDKRDDKPKKPYYEHYTNLLYLNLGRLYYRIKQEDEGNQYFNLVIQNYPDTDIGRIRAAIDILSARSYSEDALEILQPIRDALPSEMAKQWKMLLLLNLTPETYFYIFNDSAESKIQNIQVVEKSMYHKIKNELFILKGIVYEIMTDTQDPILTDIIKSIEYIFEEIATRQADKQQNLTQIPRNDYKKRLAIISQRAHNIADFVNNELLAIGGDVQLFLFDSQDTDPLYAKFMELSKQIKITQNILNNWKSINEGVKINHYTFKVQEVCNRWQNIQKIEHATIILEIKDEAVEFKADKFKIISFLDELVENSRRHNKDQNNLVVQIKVETISDLPWHVIGLLRTQRRRIPSGKKFLAITVSDNGKGISLDKKEWIFSPMNTTSENGSGLGLFIIQKTLEVMNGHIFERGTEGECAKFEIYIPDSSGGGK